MAQRNAVTKAQPAGQAGLFAPPLTSLPPSVAMVVKDATGPDGTPMASGWQAPTFSIPLESLEQARRAMEHMLKPAGDEGLRQALFPLLLSTVMPNTEGMSDETQQSFFAAKVGEYSRLMSGLPVDIIRDACDQHVKRSKFFPAIAELMQFAEPALGHRQRQAKRLEWLIKSGGQPVVEPFKPEPRDVVLKTLIKHAERRGQPEKAAAYRHELDVLEGRAVEKPKPAPSVMPDDRDAKRPSAPLPTREQGQAIAEEPPMPTDIPE